MARDVLTAAVEARHPLLLVSEDAALSRLVALEAEQLALALETVAALPSPLPQAKERIVMIDLDYALRHTDTVLHRLDEVRVAIGFCRSAEQLPIGAHARFLTVLERPFRTSELRALLMTLRDGVARNEPAAEAVTPAVRATAPSLAHLPIRFSTTDSRVVECGEVSVRLTTKERAMLELLLRRRGEVVDREELDRAIASDGRCTREGNAIEVYLCHLRTKLEKPLGVRLITTVRGQGYRLE